MTPPGTGGPLGLALVDPYPYDLRSEVLPTMSEEMFKRLVARKEQAEKERRELKEKRNAIVQLAEQDGREDLTEDEDREFRDLVSQLAALDPTIEALTGRITELADEMERDRKLAEGSLRVKRAMANATVTKEARTYEKGNGNSYLQDLVRVQLNMDGDSESRARLQRHADEVRTDREYRDLDRTDGSGGYFVPPLWLMSQWIDLARAGRATANVVTMQDLPGGTDSINIPKLDTGTATGIQPADLDPITDVDATDDFVTAPVRTIAGQQDIAVQLLDQSPINFDEVIFRDLVADYATKVDLQVIGGTGLNGQVLGIRETSDIETVTAGTATVESLYSKIADAVQRIHTLRFMPPTVIVMTPRRWAFFLASVDDSKRPLFLPAANGPQNVMGTLSAVAAEQVVGQMHGLPVVTDPNLPLTEGAGTNEDVILVMRASDLLLWESGIRSRTYPAPPATAGGPSILAARIEVYGYVAFTAGRYPKSIAELGGAGLVAPSF